jgi:hypothetical protein
MSSATLPASSFTPGKRTAGSPPARSERLRIEYFDLRIAREILRVEGENAILQDSKPESPILKLPKCHPAHIAKYEPCSLREQSLYALWLRLRDPKTRHQAQAFVSRESGSRFDFAPSNSA